MKCLIPGINVKVFGRTIHSFSRIGDELYIEPLEEGLTLRTVNSSRSAFACCNFAPSFFHHYDDGSAHSKVQDSEDEAFRCKLAMKSILTVFRSISNIEKSVERVKITLNNDEARLIFQLYCRHGIVKTHNLAFIECETLQAVFTKNMSTNLLVAPPKLLCDAVVNFQTTQEEITLKVNPDKISLKNYVDDEPDPSKVVHTELTLDPDEFDSCRIGVDSDITFCLKELRAILAFSETTNLAMNMHFETAGRPIIFSIDSDSSFEANFVLATLAEAEMNSQGRSQRSQNKSKKSTQKQNSRQEMETTDFDDMMDDDLMINDETILRLDALERESQLTKPTDITNAKTVPPIAAADMMLSPTIPPQHTDHSVNYQDDHSVMKSDDEVDESVPGTPPSKKFCSIFYGLSQTSTQASARDDKSVATVLAEDTDEDD